MANVKPIANILVIDDEADIVNIVKQGLQRNGFKVTAFTDPRAALDNFRQHSKEYCVVVSDIKMPHVTGFQVAREIRGINPEVKVILMTAFEIDQEEFSKVLPSAQVDDFIKKPATVAHIKDVLLKHIGQTKQLMTTGSKEHD
jgi:CheY-like chemotaxis protein